MSDKPRGFGPPRIESYSVELGPHPATASIAAARTTPEIRVALRGDGFIERAMPLMITIGNIWVTRYQIAPDGRSVVCFLDEMPEEGAVITVGYGGEERVELPERFSQNREPGGDPT